MIDELLIEAAAVVTMDPDDRILAPGWIHVRDGRIAAVSARPIDVAGARRLDGSGTVAVPGLVNAHTHLFQTLIRGLFEGLPFAEWLRRIYHCGLGLDAEDWRVSAELGAVESLRSGVTTILDHQFLHDGTAWSDAIIGGVRATGARVVLARTSMDLGDLAPAESLEPVDVALAALDDLLGRHRQAIADRTVRVLGGPNTPGVSASDGLCVAAARHAADRGIGLSMHVAESPVALESVARRYGVDGVVRWLDGLDALPVEPSRRTPSTSCPERSRSSPSEESPSPTIQSATSSSAMGSPHYQSCWPRASSLRSGPTVPPATAARTCSRS
jgi:5-methylthioadenosine/S-adenosylhomocysteine deaminase